MLGVLLVLLYVIGVADIHVLSAWPLVHEATEYFIGKIRKSKNMMFFMLLSICLL